LSQERERNVTSVLRVVAAGIFAGCVATAAAAQNWPAAEMRQNLFAGCFLNEREGWTVGDLGRIFHTVDGAKTWQQQGAQTKRPFVGLACVDAAHLWAAGQVGQIAHSVDGGKTWQMQTSGTDRQLLDIAFANAQRGMAVGDYGTMVRTDDGGATWSKVSIPADIKLPPEVAETVDPGDILLYDITFVDPDHAWVAGEFGVILASTDGGQTWHSQNSGVEETLFGVAFADQQHGWAVGLDATLLSTTDGGISWRKQEIETPKGFSPALYAVAVLGNYGWAIGDKGYLLSSKDAGATWQRAKVPAQMGSSWFRAVSLLPEGRGFIVGATGMVLAADRDSFTSLKQRF
jgi:photosystem II stability/assembly factor-like uncharacterized protein